MVLEEIKRYFLIGGSGKLGTELQKHLACWAPDSDIFDITDTCDWEDITINEYDSVILCAAYTNVPGSEIHRKEAVETNICGPKNIANIFENKRIVYISTDYVYAGYDGDYKETDKPEPFNFYGFTKLAGEAYMSPTKDLIIRTSFKPLGEWPFPSAFIDLYTSADYVDVIAKEIAFVISTGITGIINVGTERKSIYDLASRRTPSVRKMSKDEITRVNLPDDISMDISKLTELKNKYGGKNNER